MTRQLQMTVILSTLVLLLAVGWPISLWGLGECLHVRGPLLNPWGWLTEPQRFGRTPVKNHWFSTCDRSITAAAYELCCNDLLNNFSGPLDAYWCVVNSVFTHCGPQYAKVRFSRVPIRRIGALPHTLTTDRPTIGTEGVMMTFRKLVDFTWTMPLFEPRN